MSAVPEEESPSPPLQGEANPRLATDTLHLLGRSSFEGQVELCLILSIEDQRAAEEAANLRLTNFAALTQWPDDKPNPLDSVLPAEKDVLGLLALGYANAPIGNRIITSEQTAKFHIGHLFESFGVDNRTKLGRLARQAGVFARAHEEPQRDLLSRAGYAATRAALDEIVFEEDPTDLPTLGLTESENAVLQILMDEGVTNGQMAKRMRVTEQTIKFHFSNLYRKLGVGNRNEAAIVAHFASVGVAVKSLDGVRNMQEPIPLLQKPQEGETTLYIKRLLGKKATIAMDILDARYGLSIYGIHPRMAGANMKDSNLEQLERMGIITPYMAEKKQVDLPVALLELLLNDSVASSILKLGQHRDLAIEVARETAGQFLKQKQIAA